MNKYYVIFQKFLIVSLEYRGALFLWMLVEIISFVSILFYWFAVFKSNSTVGSYQFNDIVYYYVLAPIIWGITSIFISESLPFRIKDGNISSHLLKPYNYSFSLFLQALGIKIIQYLIKFPVYITIFIFITYFLKIEINFLFLLIGLMCAVFGLILHFVLDLVVSYISFWIEDTWSLSLLKTVLISVFGGMAFPLDLVSSNYRFIFDYLPFKFVYFFPIQVAQGRLSANEFYNGLLLLGFWIVILALLAKVMWRNGLKKYGAYGN